MRSNFLLGSVAALALLTLPACAHHYYAGGYPPPPPPRAVGVIGLAPGPGYVWVPGYYDWNGRYFWTPGRWAYPPRPRAVFVPGYWGRRHGRQFWVRGYWR